MKNKQPNHFVVEQILDNLFVYGMDEDGEIITNEKGEEVIYRLKEGIRFKPLEYLCEDMDEDILDPCSD